MEKFDRMEELIKKVEQDGYLKDFFSNYDVVAVAENMVSYAPEEFTQNLYEYIDGDVAIDKNGLWSFGPFSDIRVDGVSLNDILDYYKKKVVFRQKYTNSWLRCFKRIDGKIRYMEPRTRVLHPITALRILKNWRENGCLSELESTNFRPHWKSYFCLNPFGEPDFVEKRNRERLKKNAKLHPAIYGKI